jgi:hypothetical protein
MLLSGLPDEADRRLVMVASPSFGIVDKTSPSSSGSRMARHRPARLPASTS